MIIKIRKIISNIFYYSGITYLLSKIGNRNTIILVYHRVLNKNSDFSLDLNNVSASVNNFKKQMEYLSKQYNVISLEKFLEFHKKKKKLPRNSVVITFDDGYKDNYLHAYPILKKYNLPATIFLSTDAVDKNILFWWDIIAYIINKTKVKSFELKELGKYSLKNKREILKVIEKIQIKLKNIDDKNKNDLITKLSETLNVSFPKKDMARKILLSWNEIIEMGKNNISFGSHTESHPILTNLSTESIEKEIQNSKSIIENNIGKKIKTFSYPNGYEKDFNDDIKKILKKDFKCALTYIPGTNTINSDLFELNRIFVRYDEDINLFKNKLVGFDLPFVKIYFLLNKITMKRKC